MAASVNVGHYGQAAVIQAYLWLKDNFLACQTQFCWLAGESRHDLITALTFRFNQCDTHAMAKYRQIILCQ